MTEETLFHKALAKHASERAAFLDEVCAGKPELRATVEALLKAHETSGSFLAKPPAELGQTVDSEPGAQQGEHTSGVGGADLQMAQAAYRRNTEPGTVIAGRYTLVERIGEGGMGEVWVAKQIEDWVVMKCLEKQRDRRYETASGLARDIQRYLADEPVEARPPSMTYRLGKLLRRNKGPVAAVAAVFFVLVAGAVVSTWQAVRATRAEVYARQQRDNATAAQQREADRADAEAKERQRAERAERLARDSEQRAAAERDRALKAEKAATEHAAISQAVKDFLQKDILSQADAVEQADRLRMLGISDSEVKANPTIKELLDRARAASRGDRCV